MIVRGAAGRNARCAAACRGDSGRSCCAFIAWCIDIHAVTSMLMRTSAMTLEPRARFRSSRRTDAYARRARVAAIHGAVHEARTAGADQGRDQGLRQGRPAGGSGRHASRSWSLRSTRSAAGDSWAKRTSGKSPSNGGATRSGRRRRATPALATVVRRVATCPRRRGKSCRRARRKPPTPRSAKASRSGRQYVANTGPAKRARKDATTAGRMSEMPVSEAAKLVRGLDTRQLRAALRQERNGKDRKTLVQRLQAELDRR